MISQKYLNFQDDLQAGMSLEEACRKHQITMEDAFKTLQFNQKVTPTPYKAERDVTVDKYILKRKNGYTINKNVNGERRNFGTYKTLKDARRVRDYLELNGWISNIDKVCHILKIHRKTRGRY